jgi:sugar/nucleoside kinase (ribokinase family)
VSARFDVLGVGECSLDEIVRVDVAPAPGGKARMRDRQRLPGGQTATALLGCARLGRSAAFVSSVGADEGGEIALAPLRAAGIDLRRVRRVPGAATRSAFIWVDAVSGERTVLWERDERLALSADVVTRDDVAAARVVLLDATDLPLALAVAKLARALERPCVVDADTPAPGLEALLAAASHPAISESLARALFGGADAAVRELAARGARSPIVTRGGAGAVAWIDGAVVAAPAFAVEAVDATGAGDAFHAGIADAILDGQSGERLLRVALGAAACACRRVGAQAGLPTQAELAELLRSSPPPTRVV